MKIGFIGLGIMGSRMALNLQKAGHDLIVFNRSQDKADELVANGAIWADSPSAVIGQGVEILITMLAHPEAVKSYATGSQGFLPAMSDGMVWVDCSTVNPSFSKEMATLAREHHVMMLDAPVAGTKPQAANGELIFIVGGPAEAVEYATPLFEVMGSRVVHVGESGMGASLKVVVNGMLAISMAAFAEGVALGRSLGIPEEMLLNVLIGGPVAAPFLAGKRPKIESGDYEPDFPLQWMQKDLQLATTTAYETQTSSAMAAIAKELFGNAIRAGYGEQDFSAIYAYFNNGDA